MISPLISSRVISSEFALIRSNAEIASVLVTAFRMFMSMSKMVKGIPFSVTIPEGAVTRTDAISAFERMRASTAGSREMTLDEINAEISAVRNEKKTIS